MATKVEITSNVNAIKQATQLAIEQALETCGGMCEGYAQDILTDFPRVDEGTLRNHVTHQVNGGEKEVYIGTNIKYAPYVEYGTGIYADKGGRQTPWFYTDKEGVGHWTRGMRPCHFLRDALHDHKEEYEEVINYYLSQVGKN